MSRLKTKKRETPAKTAVNPVSKPAHRKRATQKKTAGAKTNPGAEKKKPAGNGTAPAKKTPTAKWSQKVNATSDAMDLRKGIFEQNDSRKIAASLKRSAEKSNRRKAKPFQSAMSMLNFYINRGGKNLSEGRKKILEKTKEELRKLYHREPE